MVPLLLLPMDRKLRGRHRVTRHRSGSSHLVGLTRAAQYLLSFNWGEITHSPHHHAKANSPFGTTFITLLHKTFRNLTVVYICIYLCCCCCCCCRYFTPFDQRGTVGSQTVCWAYGTVLRFHLGTAGRHNTQYTLHTMLRRVFCRTLVHYTLHSYDIISPYVVLSSLVLLCTLSSK